jgi:elongation factor P
MAIPVNDLRAGTVFQDSQGTWLVESFEHIKMGRGSATIKVKAKNIRTGAIAEKSFISGNKVEEGEVEKKKVQYLYTAEENSHFMDPLTFDQFSVLSKVIKDLPKYIKEGQEVEALFLGSELVSVELPKNVVLAVTEAAPGERGNSVSNLMKEATVETGLSVQVPLFVEVGDKIKVDTRTGSYLERV